MKVFEKSKWIWIKEGETTDQYADFKEKFVCCGEKVIFRISCDSDYVIYINGVYAASNQYGDFEHYKIFDELDITGNLKQGENDILITVYHCGTPTSRYKPAKAGLIYEILADNRIVSVSSEKTLSRLNPNYKSGNNVLVSTQLGYSFAYDATKTDGAEFENSVEIEKNCTFFKRPIKKLTVLDKKPIKNLTCHSDTHFLVDLGGETVGLPVLELISDEEQTITVVWGEHIVDGCVRKVLDYRNFYYTYKTKKGHNHFTEYMLRLGCRYLEIFSEKPIELVYAGVLPQVYEVEVLPTEHENPLDKQIYDTCINTLKLCMMEHYVDCPWREQALYSFDSRNQMLFGYLAFKDGNKEYARSNLKLMGMDRRDDNLLSITYPCGIELAIPSFSLYYIVAVNEYLKFSKDKTLASEMFGKMQEILEVFANRKENGVIYHFSGENFWNFYDWSEYGNLHRVEVAKPDFLINALFVMAIDAFDEICFNLGKDNPFAGMKDNLITSIRKEFLTDSKLFTVLKGENAFTVLGNALAIISGVATKQEAEKICENIVSGNLIDCSLSTKFFEYQALLDIDSERYQDFILNEIRKNYKFMLDSGSDTFWETLNGPAGSHGGGAGSLCHGWSAIPVYVYHRLGFAKRKED